MTESTDVAIIGAGPYGLSLATHLAHRNVPHRIFGHPMQTWLTMPKGMFLKSTGPGTDIYTPRRERSLPAFCRARGVEDYEPIEMATFAQYGLAIQQERVPYLEQTFVTRLARDRGQFALTTEDGAEVIARRVVVAVGITHFQRMPPELAALPPCAVSHTAAHADYTAFAGRDVTVVGAGQSALEAAALLHDSGAHVRIVARDEVRWGHLHQPKNLWERISVPNTVLGHGRSNWVLQHLPGLMHHLPDERRLRFTKTHLGPYGSWWLRDRVDGEVETVEHTTIGSATMDGGRVRLKLSARGGATTDVLTDYVVAGTGYEADLARLTFITDDLADGITRIAKAPRLSRRFESSVPGLYFIGPISAPSFGPLVRFVAGADFTVSTLAKALA